MQHKTHSYILCIDYLYVYIPAITYQKDSTSVFTCFFQPATSQKTTNHQCIKPPASIFHETMCLYTRVSPKMDTDQSYYLILCRSIYVLSLILECSNKKSPYYPVSVQNNIQTLLPLPHSSFLFEYVCLFYSHFIFHQPPGLIRC